MVTAGLTKARDRRRERALRPAALPSLAGASSGDGRRASGAYRPAAGGDRPRRPAARGLSGPGRNLGIGADAAAARPHIADEILGRERLGEQESLRLLAAEGAQECRF